MLIRSRTAEDEPWGGDSFIPKDAACQHGCAHRLEEDSVAFKRGLRDDRALTGDQQCLFLALGMRTESFQKPRKTTVAKPDHRSSLQNKKKGCTAFFCFGSSAPLSVFISTEDFPRSERPQGPFSPSGASPSNKPIFQAHLPSPSSKPKASFRRDQRRFPYHDHALLCRLASQL